jgi:hypothetical protein
LLACGRSPRERRHSFVSLLSDQGVPIEQIARLVGHAGGSALRSDTPLPDFAPDGTARAVAVAQEGGLTYIPRSYHQVAALLDGLDLLEPGIVPMLNWRSIPRSPYSVYYWVALARSRPPLLTGSSQA